MEKTKRKVGRPTTNQDTRSDDEARPKRRVPMHGNFRDILTVTGTDPAYEYRWVSDVDERGSRIFKFNQAGWHFAPKDGLGIGEHSVYRSASLDSDIVRKPAGKDGRYLYLMRIEREYYEEDQAAKDQIVLDRKRDLLRQKDAPGFYGKIEIDDHRL